MIVHFSNIAIPAIPFVAAVLYILFIRRDQFDAYAKLKPLPSCFASDPGPQQRAENCCDDCWCQIPCLLPAPREHAWSGDGNRCAVTGYDGPICLRCGLPDLPSTPRECAK